MFKPIFAALFLSSLAICADQTSEIQAQFETAGWEWRLADQGDNEQIRFSVFIPDNQTAENHTEKLVVYLSKNQPMPTSEVFDQNIKAVARFFVAGFGSTFTHETLESKEDSIMAEFSEKQSPDVKGIIKCQQVPEGNLLVGYFTSDASILESRKPFFVPLIQSIK